MTQTLSLSWETLTTQRPELKYLSSRLLSVHLSLCLGARITPTSAWRLIRTGKTTYHKVVADTAPSGTQAQRDTFQKIYAQAFERRSADTRAQGKVEYLTDADGRYIEERGAGFIRRRARYVTREGTEREGWVGIREEAHTTEKVWTRDAEGKKVYLKDWQQRKGLRMKKEKTTETTERVTYIEGEEGHKVDGIVRRYIRRLFSRYEGNIGYASTFNSQTGRTHTRTSVASFSSYDVEQDICRILWECITGDRDNELSALVRDELTDANLERIRKTLCVASRRRFLDLLTQAEQTPLRFVSDTNELERIAFDTDLIPEKGDADADDISYQQIEATYMTQIQ